MKLNIITKFIIIIALLNMVNCLSVDKNSSSNDSRKTLHPKIIITKSVAHELLTPIQLLLDYKMKKDKWLGSLREINRYSQIQKLQLPVEKFQYFKIKKISSNRINCHFVLKPFKVNTYNVTYYKGLITLILSTKKYRNSDKQKLFISIDFSENPSEDSSNISKLQNNLLVYITKVNFQDTASIREKKISYLIIKPIVYTLK